MSDESGSVTMLADIPGNCGMYTAEKIREYINSGVGVDVQDLEARMCGLIKSDPSGSPSGDPCVVLSSGVDGNEAVYLNKQIVSGMQARVKVMLEDDFSCGVSGIRAMEGITAALWNAVEWQCKSGGASYNDALLCQFDRFSYGYYAYNRIGGLASGDFDSVLNKLAGSLSLYDAMESNAAYSGPDSGIFRVNSGIRAVETAFYQTQSGANVLNGLLKNIESSGSVCNLISGCMSGTISGLRSGIAELENCCSNVSDLSGAVGTLNTAIASLNTTVSGISEALCGIAAAVSGLPQAIVDAIDEAAAEPDASPAMVRAAAKIEEVAQPKVQDMNADINPQVEAIADALDGVADDAMEVSDALDEVADATDGATSESASAAASGANEASDTASNESTEVGAITFFP